MKDGLLTVIIPTDMNHDITHCNNKDCPKSKRCHRFVAWYALEYGDDQRTRDQQIYGISMLANTEEDCINKNYKFFWYES